MRLLGLPTINLFRGDGGTGINLVVSDVSGLVLAPDALKGGMTPERAYSFGRAALYLRPENTLLALVDAGQLRAAIEGGEQLHRLAIGGRGNARHDALGLRQAGGQRPRGTDRGWRLA